MIGPFTSFSTYPHFCSFHFTFSLHTPWFCRVLHFPSLSQSGPPHFTVIAIAEVQVDLGRSACVFLRAHQVWLEGLFLLGFYPHHYIQVCVLIYFIFIFLNSPFFFSLVSQLTRSPIRQPCWIKNSHILTCTHCLVWLTRFHSHCCLYYHLLVRFVSLQLPPFFYFPIIHWKWFLKLVLKEWMLSFHKSLEKLSPQSLP